MKKIFSVPLTFSLSLFLSTLSIPALADWQFAPLQETTTCQVTKITDGDTFKCRTLSGDERKVRMNQIDAPESKQAYGKESTQRLKQLIDGQYIQLVTYDTDKYGRTVGEAYYNGENINKKMVEEGMAWAYRQYVKDNEYMTLEHSARLAQVGLWAEEHPVYPSEFRHPDRIQLVTLNPNFTLAELGNIRGTKTKKNNKKHYAKKNNKKKAKKNQHTSKPTRAGKYKSKNNTKMLKKHKKHQNHKSNKRKHKKSVIKAKTNKNSKSAYASCGTKRTCKQMRSCAEAKYFLNTCGITRLDRDGDNIPCESLCK